MRGKPCSSLVRGGRGRLCDWWWCSKDQHFGPACPFFAFAPGHAKGWLFGLGPGGGGHGEDAQEERQAREGDVHGVQPHLRAQDVGLRQEEVKVEADWRERQAGPEDPREEAAAPVSLGREVRPRQLHRHPREQRPKFSPPPAVGERQPRTLVKERTQLKYPPQRRVHPATAREAPLSPGGDEGEQALLCCRNEPTHSPQSEQDELARDGGPEGGLLSAHPTARRCDGAQRAQLPASPILMPCYQPFPISHRPGQALLHGLGSREHQGEGESQLKAPASGRAWGTSMLPVRDQGPAPLPAGMIGRHKGRGPQGRRGASERQAAEREKGRERTPARESVVAAGEEGGFPGEGS